jgi:hypothetical protein
MKMTAERLLHLNGDLKDPENSEMMEVVRRFHALSSAHNLPYCVIGGMAVIRNGLLRTTGDVDILTFKKDWRKVLPLQGEISSDDLGKCLDKKTGITIDMLFADEDWEMVMAMPDPREVREYDERNGAYFIGLHDLVQLKMAVHLSKLKEYGPATAARDLGDVQGLMKSNLTKFSHEVVSSYHQAVRKQCMKVFEEVARVEKSKKPERRDVER